MLITGFYFGRLDRKRWSTSLRWLDCCRPGALSAHVALTTTSHHCGRSWEGSSGGGRGRHTSLINTSIQVERERVSVPTSSPRRTLTCPDIQLQTAARANPSARRECRRGEPLALWLRDIFYLFIFLLSLFFFTNILNLGSQSCLLWERMGPLLLSIALCVSVAVPQHVKGEWEKWLSVITVKYFCLFIYLFVFFTWLAL